MRPIDCIIVLVYVAGIFAVGIMARGRKKTSDEYFTGHGNFKGLFGTIIIGLSLAASFISDLSLIAFNSSAYSDGAKVLIFLICPVLAFLFLRFWFLSRYLAAKNRHPYDVVEARFGYPVRACLSVMFVLLRVGWMSLIIYAPTLIIMSAMGLSDGWFWPIILIIGTTCTLMSTIGGIRGVIVTDAVQFSFILIILTTVCVTVLVRLHAPVSVAFEDLRSHGKLDLFDFSFSLTKPWTFWAVVIGQTVCSLGQYMADQMALQRYLASDSQSGVFKSFVVNLVGSMGATFLLVMVGLLLWVWYFHRPDASLPKNPDEILPYFAVRELPPGMAGLLVASFIAATMNTLTSGINSLAGAIINDFVARLGRQRSGQEMFHLARRISLGIGLFATLSAGFAGRLGTIVAASNTIMGAVLGPMLAAMVWAVSGARARPMAVFTGMILGAIASALIGASVLASFWVAPGGFLVAIVIPWIDALYSQPKAAKAE